MSSGPTATVSGSPSVTASVAASPSGSVSRSVAASPSPTQSYTPTPTVTKLPCSMYYTFEQRAVAPRRNNNYTLVKLEHGDVPGVTVQRFRSAPQGVHVRATASPSTDPESTTVYPYVTYGREDSANIAFGVSAFGSPPTLQWNELALTPFGVYTDEQYGDVYAANGNDLIFRWTGGQGQPSLATCTADGFESGQVTVCTQYPTGLMTVYAVVGDRGQPFFVADGGGDLTLGYSQRRPAVVRFTSITNDNNNIQVCGDCVLQVCHPTHFGDIGKIPPLNLALPRPSLPSQARNDGQGNSWGSWSETIVDGFWMRPYGLLQTNTNGALWVADAGNVTAPGACNGFIAKLPNLQNDYIVSRNTPNKALVNPPFRVGIGWSSPRGLWMTRNGDLYVADAGCGTAVPSFLAKVTAAVLASGSNFTVTPSMKMVTVPDGAIINGVSADPVC